jgi:outer membrane cobalamin receptor
MKFMAGEYEIIVDDEDYPLIKDYKWAVSKHPYPRATINGVRYYLHTFILLLHEISYTGMTADHKNGDTLDNRKENLRVCTSAQNIANSRKKNGCKSRYKGVRYDTSMKRRKRWMAACEFGGKCITIGRYGTEEEAALAYNKKAKELWGDYAWLNKESRPSAGAG